MAYCGRQRGLLVLNPRVGDLPVLGWVGCLSSGQNPVAPKGNKEEGAGLGKPRSFFQTTEQVSYFSAAGEE